ncbi:MAG: iron-sulfur cluster repair di-iron protein [Ignavibacteria bacterium]|jgi:regulator of cell morphogenesis and NO signaling|nr:iron-sulfur cluster repair di-iron protein [Ignavibacteria bacterium]MCU7504904.1 iron-sulfur cluster repair di-iron protein [Ignavibacteria bacterium]MCU7517804.1 iron-sulfur cluster repair di-iron protein [Ignavibacteria bacterium]
MEVNGNINQDELKNLIVKDIVASNFKSAEVFEKYGIDFCCKGNRPLGQACQENGVNMESLAGELKNIFESGSSDTNRYDMWQLSYLADYIVNNHHSYVKTMSPVISARLEKVLRAHGRNHPFLQDVADLFTAVSRDLELHLAKEEQVLFPMIKKIDEVKASGNAEALEKLSTVSGPIRVMISEHDRAGDILDRIRKITDNYRLPEDACTTFAVAYKELDEFERDLHKHVFLENNILFPKSLASARA